MHPSPVKSIYLSTSKGGEQSPLQKRSSRRSPSVEPRGIFSSQQSNDGRTFIHPVFDGTNRTYAQERQVECESLACSKSEWCPSDAEFVARTVRPTIKVENVNDMTSKSTGCEAQRYDSQNKASTEALSTGENNLNANTSASEHDGTDDDNYASSEDETTLPTLDTYQPREPSYAKANLVPFYTLCKRLDLLWKKRRSTGKQAVSKQDRLKYLLPDSLFTFLEGGSPYPFMRLICPDHDSSRPHTGLKEATIAKVWADAMGLLPNSNTYKKLTHYRDPEYNGTNAGDLSVVIHQLTDERFRSSKSNGSNLTVGEVNDWLDVLVDIVKDRFEMALSETERGSVWKQSLDNAINSKGQSGKKLKKHDRYVKLLEKLISKNLSVSCIKNHAAILHISSCAHVKPPYTQSVEHKWIVRILLQKIEIGINFNSILDYYNPHAKKLYGAFNNMKELCRRLSDPKYVALLKATHDQNARDIIDQNRCVRNSLKTAAI